jgi:DNA polymerase-1
MCGDRLLLVDGLAALYRAFFAIPTLTTAAGVPTNAVFGLIRMLNQLRERWHPSHWAVVFDGGLSDEKLSLLSEYKSQRPPMPEALRSQISLAKRYLDLSRIAWFWVEKQEADDVIASLVHAARQAPQTEVLIATGDKDLYQLIDGQVRVVPVSGKEGALDPSGVHDKTGVKPSQVVEWLALAGDSADNIPGVPGVGRKTAARLLDRFGTLEELYRHVEDIPGEKTRAALREHWNTVQRNVRMISLSRDLGIPLEWNRLAVHEPSSLDLVPFFEELELHRMARTMRQGDLALN